MSEERLGGDEARSRLYEVMRADCPAEERIERALQIGTEYFGVAYGYVSEIDPDSDDWEVVVSTAPDGTEMGVGLQLEFSTTYCQRTIEAENVVTFHDAPEQGLADDVAYTSSGLRCYHGAPVIVDGEVSGTVCFVDEAAREPFTDAERAFTDLVANMVAQEREREQREVELDARERELEERRELYRATIDASFDLIFRLNTDGQFTYSSPATESLLGYAPEDVVGESLTLMLPDEETEALARDLFERVLAGETAEESYLPLVTTDGDIVYVDVRVTPIYDAAVPEAERTADDVVAVQGMAHDATDRKHRERMISVLNRVLRHNLRNDMTVIEGYAGVLADRVDPEHATLAQRIRSTADRLIELSETARDLERNFNRPPDVSPTDVVPMAETVVDQLTEHHPDAEFVLDLPSKATALSAPRFETALWELAENAADHAGETPTIDISVAVLDGHVEVRIADDGPGLPEDERAVLTSGEETPLVHGSGLGLWLVHSIVASLDGSVTVLDHDGACVVVSLPRPDDGSD